MRRWEEVWALWQSGLSIPDIASLLAMSRGWVHVELNRAEAYAARAVAAAGGEALAWARCADRLAAGYQDPRARAWIYRQMGVMRQEDLADQEKGERDGAESGRSGAVKRPLAVD